MNGAKSKGFSPSFVLLTDGKGNISLDGEINKETAEMVTKTLKSGGRVIPVGTTSLRILESLDCKNKIVKPVSYTHLTLPTNREV